MKSRIDAAIECVEIREDKYPDIKDQQEQALFYKMERLATKYAKRFFEYLCEDIPTNSGALPLVFIDECFNTWQKTTYGLESGQNAQISVNKQYPKQIVINITLPRRKERAYLHERLKRCIRHEVLHYFLYIQDLPHKDNSALFWALATIYDADPYERLQDEDQIKYDYFMEQSRKYPYARLSTLRHLAYGIILDDEEECKTFESVISFDKQLSTIAKE